MRSLEAEREAKQGNDSMVINFGDFYGGGRGAVSFELFPPASPEAEQQLESVLPELIALGPDYFTVTYGAFGSTQQKTLEIASRIKNEFGRQAACHLTCVGASRAELTATIEQIYGAGIRNIVALRGDPPKGASEFHVAQDGLAHAEQLVRLIRETEARHEWEPMGIAVAGYPEKHLEAPDRTTDLANLKRKVDAGANVVITQLFYDNADYFTFVDAARRLGIEAPIVPGLLPAVSLKQVERIAGRCGSKVPAGLRAELEKAGDDAAAMAEIGVRHCVTQAQELLGEGVPGVHFYVLNRAGQMARIMDAIQADVPRARSAVGNMQS